MVQTQGHITQEQATGLAASAFAPCPCASCDSPMPAPAKLCWGAPSFRRGLAQTGQAGLLVLKAFCWKALTDVKAKPRQTGKDKCRQLKSSQYLGVARAWRPAVTPQGNKWPLAQGQGLWARYCSMATRSLVPLLASPQTSSIAPKNPETASRSADYARLTKRPVVAALHIAQILRLAFCQCAGFCVPTSRRQRTSHV